jgi:hypothetical protein
MQIEFKSMFLKADEVKKGETITILDPGVERESKFKYENGDSKVDYVFTVEYQGEQKKLTMNTASRRSMREAFSKDTLNWVGKQAKVFVMPTPKGDKKMIVLDPIIEE